MKRDTILLSRQNRHSRADRLKEKRVTGTERRGNTSWFTLREVIMEIIYQIALWAVVFCHYTWSQAGKNTLFPLSEPKPVKDRQTNERRSVMFRCFHVRPLHIKRVASETDPN